MSETFSEIAPQLVAVAGGFHSRGWMLGTSGNLSAVVNREPFCMAMTPSGCDKGSLRPEQILMIDDRARATGDLETRPSAESPLHLMIAKEHGAEAVLHTHSIWSTMLSDLYGDAGGLAIEGYEMLKGLAGVNTHEHSEWLPIVANSQDMTALAAEVDELLRENSAAHGFLVRRHGLYTWGDSLAEARRHIEILEFLLEVVGQTLLIKAGAKSAEV